MKTKGGKSGEVKTYTKHIEKGKLVSGTYMYKNVYNNMKVCLYIGLYCNNGGNKGGKLVE